MNEADTEDHLGLLGRRAFEAQIVEHAEIAIGAQIINAVPVIGLHQFMGDVARGHNEIIVLAGDAELRQMACDLGSTSRRIGEQRDEAALPAMRFQRFDGGWKMRHAIMNDTPDIA